MKSRLFVVLSLVVVDWPAALEQQHCCYVMQSMAQLAVGVSPGSASNRSLYISQPGKVGMRWCIVCSCWVLRNETVSLGPQLCTRSSTVTWFLQVELVKVSRYYQVYVPAALASQLQQTHSAQYSMYNTELLTFSSQCSSLTVVMQSRRLQSFTLYGCAV
jgi:hypothetical protein